MSYKRTTISFGSTGVKSISWPFGTLPIGCRITLGGRFSSTDSCNHLSIGNSNGSTQSFHSTYSDNQGHQTISGINKLVSHYERIGGVITEVVSATINSFSTTDIKINVTTANPNYQFHVEIWD